MSKGFINIEVKGLKDIENYYRSLNKNSQALMEAEVKDFGDEVVAAMRNDAPVNLAQLKNSIHKDVKKLSITFTVPVDYAPYMEWGTKKRVNVPSYVASYAAQFKGRKVGGTVDSKEAIKDWSKKKGINDWSSVWWHIMKNGVKPHPFFFTTKSGQNRLEIIKTKYKEALLQALNNVIKK